MGAIDWKEIRQAVHLAWPIMFTFILQTSIGLVGIIFVGHIGTHELVAASLGNMLANIMGFSVGIGFASAMDTLCTQAYGARNYFMLGTICQRSILILGCLCLPLGAIWMYAAEILVFIGQQPEVAELTGTYMKYQLLGLWPQFIFTSLNKYMQTQGITHPSMHVVCVVALFNPFLTYALVYPLGLGFDGAALAVSICRILLAGLLALYIWVRGLYHDTWGGWSVDSLRGWGTFLSLGLPGCIMVCAEWWACELLTLAAGWIGTTELATQTILGNTTAMVFSIPLSFAIACSISVGHHLGAGKPNDARMAWRAGVQFAAGIMTVLMLLLISFRSAWPYLFTDNQSVGEFATQLLPVLAFYCITDTVQAVASGALRGCGHQRVGALCNLFSYYIVGLPVSFYCAFELNLGLYGLWIGNSIGSILQATLLLAAVWRTSWEHESELAKIRVSGGPLQQIDIVDGLPASALTSTPSIMGVDPTFSPHFERNRASRRGSYVRIN